MANPWDDDPVLDQPWTGDDPVTVRDQFMKRLDGMSHAQIVEAYRKTKPGNPWGDFLGTILEQQMPGETAGQRDKRIGKGKVSAVSDGASTLAGFADVGNYGFYDEGAAALDWLLGRNTYEGGLKNRRQQQDELRDANPNFYAGGQVAGAVPIIAQSALALPAAGEGLAAATTMGAVEGLGQGALYGAGSGEGLQDRAKQALEQGLIGLALGGAAPVMAKGVGAGYRYLVDAAKNSKPMQKATQSIWQMLQDNGLTLDQARAAISQIGDRATLGDISPGMQVEVAAASAADSGAQSITVPRYEARDKMMEARTKGALDDAFGVFKDPQDIADSVVNTKSGANKQLKGLEEYVIDANPVLDEINAQLRTFPKGTPIGNKLLELRQQIIPDQGLPSKDMMDRGHLMQGFKIATRDEADAAYTAGRKEMGRVLKAVSGKANEVLRDSVQDYAEANKAWHGAQKVQEQFDFGQQKLLGENVYPGQANKTWAELNEFEKEARLQGTRAKLEMKTTGRPNPGQRADRLLSQSMNDKKVGTMLDESKPGALKKVKGKLEGMQNERETYDLVAATRGSRTAPVTQVANRRWGTNLEPNDGLTGMLGNAATAGAAGGAEAFIGSLGLQGASKIGKGILSRLGGPNGAVISAAGDLLSREGPEARNTIRLIIKMLRDQGKTQKQAEAIVRNLTAGGRGLAPVAGPQLSVPYLGGGDR